MGLVQAKIIDGRSALGEEIKAREKSQKYTNEIGAEICNLYADIDQARQFRTEKGKKLVQGIDTKFNEIRDAIAAEQRIREDSESTMLEMLQDMGLKMQNELDGAKLERRKSQERLVQLMEKILPQMCSNLQQRGGPKQIRRSKCCSSHLASVAEPDPPVSVWKPATMTHRQCFLLVHLLFSVVWLSVSHSFFFAT